jgi:hypothetical protein
MLKNVLWQWGSDFVEVFAIVPYSWLPNLFASERALAPAISLTGKLVPTGPRNTLGPEISGPWNIVGPWIYRDERHNLAEAYS